MSIVLPKLPIPKMTTVGVQADVTDPEGIVGIILSFKDQLLELQNINSTLVGLRQARQETLSRTEALSHTIDEQIRDLVNGAETMESLLQSNMQTRAAMDTELEDLINENERLEAEIGEMRGQEVEINNTDVDNEQRLVGFAEEELFQKMEALSSLQKQLSDVSNTYKTEWEEFKNDMSHSDQEQETYRTTTNHIEELKLARYIGTLSSKETDESSRNFGERLISHHWNKLIHRQLQNKLNASLVQEKDLEDEIGKWINMKKDLWKRCLDLENCLDEVKDTTDDVIMLRPSPAYADLPDVIDGRFTRLSSSDVDLESRSLEEHGKMLHRCQKHTNINIALSASEEDVVESTTKADVCATDQADVATGSKDGEAGPQIPSQDETSGPGDDQTEQVPGQDDHKHGHGKLHIGKLLIRKLSGTTLTGGPSDAKKHDLVQPPVDAGTLEPSPSLTSKLRMRLGKGSSSSQKIKTTQLTSTSSTKRFSPVEFMRRKR